MIRLLAAILLGVAAGWTRTIAQTYPAPNHIVVVIMENHDYADVVGNTADAPYINGTLIPGGRVYTNFRDCAHPSEPNYLCIYAGSNFGVRDDEVHRQHTPDLYTALKAAGKSFVAYSEQPIATPLGKHNPWRYFPEGASVEKDLQENWPTNAAGYAALPNVAFVIPNQNDDWHDGTVLQGDSWLQQNIDGYAQWAKTHNSLLILTTDEGKAGDTILTLIYGANVVPGTDGMALNHLSTLATLCAMEGIANSCPRSGVTGVAYPASGVSGS